MSRGGFRIKRRVWVGLLAGIASVGMWGWWARSQPVVPAGSGRDAPPFVQLASVGTAASNQLLRERAELLDPTPLFFPTEWNYGQGVRRENNPRQPGQVFDDFDPKLTMQEQGVAPYGTEAITVPEKLSDLLVQGNEAPFAGMGQVDLQTTTLPVRAGFVEVKQLRDGKNVLSQSLSGIQPPRTDFAPIEFLVAVGSAGLIGEPILASGSGWDEVDTFFRTYLVKSYRLGERLPPGRYRVIVGA